MDWLAESEPAMIRTFDLLTASTSASPVRMICTFFPIMACVSLKKNTMAREPAPEKLPFPPDTAPEIASA